MTSVRVPVPPPAAPTAPATSMPTPTVPSPALTGASPGATGTSRLTGIWSGRSPAASSDAVWVPMVSGALILVVGAMTLATKQPWLFAGLGPTALIIASSPGHPTTRFHSIVLGHAIALACAVLALLLLGANDTPSLLAGSKTIPHARVWASAFAVAIIALVQPSFRAYHPPAAATALLVTMGVYKLTWKMSLSIMAGVLVVALLGEWFQRLRLNERRAARREGHA